MLGVALALMLAACADPVDPTSDGPEPSPTTSFARLDVYLPLIEDLVGAQGDTLFVRSDICRGAEAPGETEGSPCDEGFTEAERSEIATAFPRWSEVRFVAGYEDIPDAEQPIQRPGNVFVWVGPLDERGDAYWVGAGETCGGLCGHGGTFVMQQQPDGSWASEGAAPGTGQWIS
jgi:hypothetical protein